MEKKRALKNIFVSIFFNIAVLVTGIFSTRILIDTLGEQANGLNSLFFSIMSVISVVELGVGTAITFCMYKPIIEKDDTTVVSLYCLFKKFYTKIGIIVSILGLIITPFMTILAKDYTMDYNIYILFLLMLVSVVLSYFFSAKLSLINAYKNNYITSSINYSTTIIKAILQIAVLILFQDFYLFFIVKIVSVVIQWIITNIITKKMHNEIVSRNEEIDKDLKDEVYKNIKALFTHKIGTMFVQAADGVIISTFLSVALLGKYNNYTLIIVNLTTIMSLCITPLTSMIGHLMHESKEKFKSIFNSLYLVLFCIAIFFYLGYYAVIDSLVFMLFGETQILTKEISFIITLNTFINFMRSLVIVYKDASGTFTQDRYRPIFEGILNIILSILFVKIFGVTGVIIATIITNLLICHTVEPYVMFKNALNESPKKYYIKNYMCIGVFVLLLTIVHLVNINLENQYLNFLVNGFISVGISGGFILLLIIINKEFRNNIKKILIRKE